jgi:hypothetical protein
MAAPASNTSNWAKPTVALGGRDHDAAYPAAKFGERVSVA